jgi:hypothetical protein
MTDDKHVDRYVRITNRERFLIVRALSLLEHACDTLGVAYDGLNTTPQKAELYWLSVVFSEENWLIGRDILTDKVLSVQAMEQENDEEVQILPDDL